MVHRVLLRAHTFREFWVGAERQVRAVPQDHQGRRHPPRRTVVPRRGSRRRRPPRRLLQPRPAPQCNSR